MNLSSDDMQRLFNYMEQKKENEQGDDYISLYNIQSHNRQAVFGEELQGYIPFSPNQLHHSIMERDPLQMVKSLTTQITVQYYKGEPKLVDMTASIYSDFIKARKLKGYKGVQGMNAKGIICAILYMIISYREKSRLDIKRLISSANKVKSIAKTQITKRMIFKYLNYIISMIDIRNTNHVHNNNNNNITIKIDNEIKRLCILLRYKNHEIVLIKKDVYQYIQKIPKLLDQHNITTLSIAFVYKYSLLSNKNMRFVKDKLDITPYILNKVLPKILNIPGIRSNQIPNVSFSR
jgi:hypothetical protein